MHEATQNAVDPFLAFSHNFLDLVAFTVIKEINIKALHRITLHLIDRLIDRLPYTMDFTELEHGHNGMESNHSRHRTTTATTTMVNRRKVTRAFKTRGLTLQVAALNALISVLEREDDPEMVLQALLEETQKRTASRIVTKGLLAEIVADMSRNTNDVLDEALELLDSFDTPQLYFNTLRKQFSLLTSSSSSSSNGDKKRSLLGTAGDKVGMYLQRYALVQQRILRQDLFRPKLVSADGRQASSDGRNVTHTITPVESLLGRTGTRFLLGMIVQVEEGRYYLEDHTAQVPLDMSEAQMLTDGFITENCIMLVEGEMEDEVLRVHRMGNPIVETRDQTLDVIGHRLNLFTGLRTLGQVQQVKREERVYGSEGMLVVLSDVHLDKPIVFDKLTELFRGFEGFDPLPLFVLMGNFCSTATHPKTVIGYLDDLAQLISRFPRLANDGRFVLVPGPLDPGIGGVLPRPPMPPSVRSTLQQKVRNVHFASNPCRIRYFSKEIVLFRNNLVNQLRQYSIFRGTASAGGAISETTSAQHAVKTVLDQGHLCPVRTPIYWQHDHAMRLYPLPDTVILADKADQYYENYAECDAINPGPFYNDFSFVVYRPADKEDRVELSQVP